MAAKAAPGGGYEKRDADVKRLFWLLVVLLVVTGLAALLMQLLYQRFASEMSRRQPPPATLAGARAGTPPEPRLQNTPFDELRRMRTEEDAALSSYGWVDRSAGIVRLPIDKALDLAVAGGITAAPASEQGAAGPTVGVVVLYNNSKVDLQVNELNGSVTRIAPGAASEVLLHEVQWIDFGMIAHRYQVEDRVLKELASIAMPRRFQAESDGRLYLIPQGDRFPVKRLPAQPPGFPLVPEKKVDLT